MLRTIIKKRVARKAISDAIRGLDPDPSMHRGIISTAELHGFTPESDTVKKALAAIDKANEPKWRGELYGLILKMLDPCVGSHVEAYAGHPGVIMVNTMASSDGIELVQAIVDAWIGDAAIQRTTTVQVEAYSTTFSDASGNAIVVFNSAGRKMHHSDTFRAFNAQVALQLLGVEVSFKEIAIGDGQDFYSPLVFERSEEGSWQSHELAPV